MNSSARVYSILLCRASTSADALILAKYDSEVYHCSRNDSDTVSLPPTTEELRYLVTHNIARSKLSNGKINNHGVNVHYLTSSDVGCTLVFVLTAESGLTDYDARAMLEKELQLLLKQAQLYMMASSADEMELQYHIQPAFEERMTLHNENCPTPQQMRIQALRSQVNEVTDVMADNMERMIQRGELLENMERRTAELQESSASFKSTARRVQRHFCQKNLKWTIITIVLTVIFIVTLTLFILRKINII